MPHFFLEYWQWTVGAAITLVGVLVYLHLVRKAQEYTLRVKRELEEYVSSSSPTVQPLPIPPRNPSDTATFADEKHAIWRSIHDHPLPHYPQVEVLVNQLAEARVAARFQDTYFSLLGSQHSLLRLLNSQTGSGAISREEAQRFLQQIAADSAAVAAANHDFNRWISFLVDRGLVNVGIDSVAITAGGQDFLVWVLRRQLPNREYEAF